jgi:hypothetical protein
MAVFQANTGTLILVGANAAGGRNVNKDLTKPQVSWMELFDHEGRSCFQQTSIRRERPVYAQRRFKTTPSAPVECLSVNSPAW